MSKRRRRQRNKKPSHLSSTDRQLVHDWLDSVGVESDKHTPIAVLWGLLCGAPGQGLISSRSRIGLSNTQKIHRWLARARKLGWVGKASQPDEKLRAYKRNADGKWVRTGEIEKDQPPEVLEPAPKKRARRRKSASPTIPKHKDALYQRGTWTKRTKR